MNQKKEYLHENPTMPDLTLLRSLREETPDSKMAMVRRAWPEIVAALNSGHTLKRVSETLKEDGLAIDYKTLSTYVSILRRRQRRKPGIS